MALLYGRAGCLTAQSGGFRHGQYEEVDDSICCQPFYIQLEKEMQGAGLLTRGGPWGPAAPFGPAVPTCPSL